MNFFKEDSTPAYLIMICACIIEYLKKIKFVSALIVSLSNFTLKPVSNYLFIYLFTYIYIYICIYIIILRKLIIYINHMIYINY